MSQNRMRFSAPHGMTISHCSVWKKRAATYIKYFCVLPLDVWTVLFIIRFLKLLTLSQTGQNKMFSSVSLLYIFLLLTCIYYAPLLSPFISNATIPVGNEQLYYLTLPGKVSNHNAENILVQMLQKPDYTRKKNPT